MKRKKDFVIEYELASIFAGAYELWCTLMKIGEKGDDEDVDFAIRKSAQLQDYDKRIANKAIALYKNETGDKQERFKILHEKYFQRAKKSLEIYQNKQKQTA